MAKPLIHPAWPNALAGITDGYSLGMIARDIDSLRAAAPLFPADTPVAVTLAARLGARIDALAYLDAFVPGGRQSLWDVTGEWEHERYISGQKDSPGLVAPIFGNPNGRLGWHPLLTLLEPVHHTGEEARISRHEYIFATGYAPTPFARFHDDVCGKPEWSAHEWDASHG